MNTDITNEDREVARRIVDLFSMPKHEMPVGELSRIVADYRIQVRSNKADIWHILK
jgi:hypothetical protein